MHMHLMGAPKSAAEGEHRVMVMPEQVMDLDRPHRLRPQQREEIAGLARQVEAEIGIVIRRLGAGEIGAVDAGLRAGCRAAERPATLPPPAPAPAP